MKFKKIIYIFGIIVFAFTFFYEKSEAATVLLNIPQKNIWVGDEFSVILTVAAVDQPINAFEGVLQYSDNISFQSFDLRHTINTLWVKPPKNLSSEISFAGMIPTGFRGTINPFSPEVMMPGDMVTFIFKAKKAGPVNFSLNDTNLFIHDGKGTAISVPIVLESIEIEPGQLGNSISKNDSGWGRWLLVIIFTICIIGVLMTTISYLKRRRNRESSTT